jgi:hypothetical protein
MFVLCIPYLNKAISMVQQKGMLSSIPKAKRNVKKAFQFYPRAKPQ